MFVEESLVLLFHQERHAETWVGRATNPSDYAPPSAVAAVEKITVTVVTVVEDLIVFIIEDVVFAVYVGVVVVVKFTSWFVIFVSFIRPIIVAL